MNTDKKFIFVFLSEFIRSPFCFTLEEWRKLICVWLPA
jgi:hypothetical protein